MIAACCAALGIARSRVEVSVSIVSPARMRTLNRTHRSKDKPTDVLSFPLYTRTELSTLMKKRGILPVGDIFINRSDVKKRFAFLVVHGFLHLCGYDHETSKKEERIMFTLQDEILSHLRN
ncbi:MAG: rRNA maturation RNase YbeY [Candidatus Yanofskybacteria bacterium RIFCSPLOWO2_01_FULL_49_25]|uniref:Endoribonuclease YbeY n=1 Tax=Candidatus Yanofskybacteria bacterium RIFCSPLOWO2_01_FULL_49_25 TaxID=1802701 RepID=A0A1F8GTF4_9BACT|nr:MAG: rRNA maturation RNase YbeY [Candidatus Yanofskybacteria bacterium RIFCSPLOWO2_01_FULL_49_25]